MHFAILPVAASLLSLVLAQNGGPNAFQIPPSGLSLVAGQPTELNWDPTTPGKVSLYLRSGDSGALDEGELIEAGIDNNGQYTYTPPPSVVRSADYTIEIVSDSDPSQSNFTPPFVIESSNTVKSVTAVKSSASATPAASSSAASSSAAASSSVAASSSAAASSSSSLSSSLASASASAKSSSAASSSAVASSSAASIASRSSSATAQLTASRASATSVLITSTTRATRSAASSTGNSTETSAPTSFPGEGAGAKVYGLSSAAALVLLCMMAVW